MSLLIVCPVILPPRDDVLASWTHRPHLAVINGRHDRWQQVCSDHRIDAHRSDGNAGCPRSWNIGFAHARERGIDHVAIVSQSLVIPPPGTIRLAELVAERADHRGLITNWSFHCAVFSVALWERIGPFDAALPIYCDIDYARRLYEAGERTPANPMPDATFPADSTRCATLRAGLIAPDTYDIDRERYIAKWGHEPVDPCANSAQAG